MVNVTTHAKVIAKKLVQVDVNRVVVEFPVAPVHLHPTIILNNHFQVVPIALEDARTVALLVVVLLVTKSVKVLAKRLVRGPALVDVWAHVIQDVKTLVKQDVKKHVEQDVKMVVHGNAKTHVKVLVQVVVIMLVIQHAKELAQIVAIILACIIAQDVAGRLINQT
jgi:hypothetical protein